MYVEFFCATHRRKSHHLTGIKLDMKALLFLVILQTSNKLIICELYSALAGLETLLETQKVIIQALNHHIESLESVTEKLKKAKESYTHLQQVSSADFQDFVSNPINAFVLIKKLTIDWKEIKRLLPYFPTNDTISNVIFPDENDLSGAAKALLRVQQTYNLNTMELAEGKIATAPRGLTLSADDCFEIGRQAFHAGFYENALSWMDLTKTKLSENNEEVRNSSEVARYLTMSSYEKGKFSVMMLTNSLVQLSLMMAPSLQSSVFSNSLSLDRVDSNNDFTSRTNVFDEVSYKQLCQSSIKITSPTYSSQLQCHHVVHHPYFFLQPVKEEMLWKEPKISLYYDIISDKEIETLKSLARPALRRAEVAEYNNGVGHKVSETRVTKIAWLNESDHPLIPKMYSRIEAITGLSSDSAEPFQMANYGLGGHFHLHMDVLPDTDSYFGPNLGNRIATWLTYLSNVHGGGATVFPRLNLTVWPKKGSALFWHNIKSNGIGNILTLHGACPVVTGSKWITNVWFHERGQEFRLKCGKYPDSALQPINLFSKT